MSQIDRNYEEKRDFIRMTMNATATVTWPNGEQKKVTVIDLSATGMHLKTDTALEEGTDVVVHIESPNSQFKSMLADCSVLRCLALDDNNFDVGLQVNTIR